jgi:hypothetical protein
MTGYPQEMSRAILHLIFALLLASNAVHAQEDSTEQVLFSQIYLAAEEAYGVHQELLNGLLFESKNQEASGHPYFLDYYSNQGSVIYGGKQYSNLNLRYDIYDQELLLIYPIKQLEYKLYLRKELITGFKVENKTFTKESFPGNKEAKYHQVFGKDLPIKILYFREKSLSKLYANNSDDKKYSERRETYILIDNELLSYKGNRSLAHQFSSDHEKAIKQYLRLHKIKVKLADDEEMERLLNFIHSITFKADQ